MRIIFTAKAPTWSFVYFFTTIHSLPKSEFSEPSEEGKIPLTSPSIVDYARHIKVQIILKGLLVSSNSPKKRTDKFVFTTTTNSFLRFLGEFEDTKKSFQNYLAFICLIDKSQPNLYNLVLFGVCSPFFPVDIESQLSYVSSHESQPIPNLI